LNQDQNLIGGQTAVQS